MTPLTAISSIRHTVSGLNLLEQIILLSLLTIAVCCTFWDEMIFDKVGDRIKLIIGEFWAKPLFACYVCATFWHSILWCLLFAWPWYLCFPALGLSAVISLLQHD